jgi:hypothetical protein
MPMKHRYVLIILLLVVVIVGVIHWRRQQQQKADVLLRDATRYAGATGQTITAFDERTDRLLSVMRKEAVEVTLKEMTDGAQYMIGMVLSGVGDTILLHTEEDRERCFYRPDIEIILSNRRFRKAFEDLQKINKKKAAELLTKNIRDNLDALRPLLQKDIDTVSQGKHIGSIPGARLLSTDSGDFHRPTSDPNHPPTRFGRRYALLSYILLASFLELQEARPAVEEVAKFSKEEFRLFNRIEFSAKDLETFDVGAYSFKANLLADSLYNPSLLVTATLCDPTWNTGKRKRLEAKLISREVVDYQARAVEQDKDAREGWLPVVPHDGMLKIRYYQGITDEELNDFFGE